MCPEAKVMFATKYVQISSKVKKGDQQIKINLKSSVC